LDKFGLVYFKTAVKERDLASCTAHYLSGQDVRYINRAVLMNFSDSKLLQYIIMANAKIRVPKTVFINLAILGSHYFEVKTKLGLPFVLKDIEGKKGRNNYLINSENDFKKAIKAAKANGLQMVAQKYIPNDGDYRVLVFGKQVPLVIHRKAKTGHINNTSVGAEARIVEKGEVPGKAQRMAIEAASIMNLDIAGVDLVKDNSSGNWYCLEVNRGPQLATGAFKQEKVKIFANYIKKQQEKILL
jgi:ribosomal protein S6--L-glutamate ligase